MSKPENRYIARVHKKLHESVYTEKMANPFRGGTPDVYYEGDQNDLWVEYKYLESLPLTFTPTNPNGKTKVTPLQAKWLRRAYGNGRNVCVILGIGTNEGIIIQIPELDETFSREDLSEGLMPNTEIAKFIEDMVLG